MSAEHRYEAALTAALSVTHFLETEWHLSRQEKLAKATYIILDAIYRAEEGTRAEGTAPSAPAVRVLPGTLRRLIAAVTPDRSKLLRPR